MNIHAKEEDKKMIKYIFTILFIAFGLVITPAVNCAEKTSLHEYTAGTNDMLEIKVLDYPDLRTVTTVATDGSITFPYIGTLNVKGKRLSEIEEEITKKLGESFIKYPVVAVSLVKSESRKIFAYGEVARPGEFPFGENITVVKALSIAGGITANGLYGKVKVRRKQTGEAEYKDIDIDLKGTIEGSTAEDMLLQPDDIIIVERNKTFFVYGEVNRPGEYVLEKDLTAVGSLSIAGGITANGLYGKVKVRRKQTGEAEYKDIDIDLKGTIEGSTAEDMLLQPDDIIIVERNKTFFVYGEVNKPGEYVLTNDMTVLKSLSLAGGFTKWGSPGRVKVLRPKNNNAGYETIKADIDDAIGGDAAKDISLQSGDIVVLSTGIF